MTLADRLGPIPEFVMAGLALAGLLGALGSALRERRQPRRPETPSGNRDEKAMVRA
jgi:hypothetical protein